MLVGNSNRRVKIDVYTSIDKYLDSVKWTCMNYSCHKLPDEIRLILKNESTDLIDTRKTTIIDSH
jgi:hypothetical protein